MPWLTVRPDDLAVVGARTSGDADALTAASLLLSAAAQVARASLGLGAGVVAAAVDDYAHVDGVVAAALGEAGRILAEGFVEAADGYRAADASVTADLGRRPRQ